MAATRKPKTRGILFTVFFTIFLDLLGLGIIIPVIAPLFLDYHHGILPPNADFATRNFVLGLLIAAYPLAQFFGAPVLGGLSDREGRRKILLIALTGTFIGYIIFALGILWNDLLLLFASRALSGFTGGNISIIQSAIADMSTDEKSRNKNFGLIGMGFALGFIFGPYFGGKLADPTVVSWFNYATPFWFAAILAAANIALVLWRFPETLLPRHRNQVPISALTGFYNIKRALGMGNVRTIFIVIFLLTFGFNFFIQFFLVYLVDKFHFSQSDIGDLFAYTGIWIAITQGLIARSLANYFSAAQILGPAILALSIAFPILLIPNHTAGLYLLVPFMAILQGLTMPNYTTIVSQLSDKKSQGEILGINQSIQSLGQAIPPIIAGLIISLHRTLPTIVAGLLTFIAWIIYTNWFRPRKREQYATHRHIT